MKWYQLTLFISLILTLAACGAETATPPPELTLETVAEVQPIATHTYTPRPTETAVPPTHTLAPEPATATPIPTGNANTPEASTTPDSQADETPSATAASTNASAIPTSANTSTSTGTAVTTPANPPAVGNVPAPTDNNYPANTDVSGWENRINVPTGFEVTYVGRVEGNPTSLTFGPDGLLYIATMSGTIYKMDENGNVTPYVSGFLIPTGIAFQPGTNKLFVSSRVVDQNVGGEAKVSYVQSGGITDLIRGLPCCYTSYHSANGIAFGADGMGYVGVGGRADHGEILDGSGRQDELHPLEASILRFNPASGDVTVYARGFRNPYDIAWDGNGQLWATDNTPDFDPLERLHRVVPGGLHGYPYYECDVCFSPPAGVTVIPPLVTFAPSSSPTGVTAYLASQFPGYTNSIFVTLWSAFVGAQKIMHIGAGGSAPTNFATGFAAPIDVTVGPDGSLYVADWATGIVFKVSYTG